MAATDITATQTGHQTTERQAWLAALAHAERESLERIWSELAQPPAYETLRAPEVGLAMVRGRAGGTGAPFNLGEMTVTRCAVRLTASGIAGFGYVAGRDTRKAELVALIDAVLQSEADGPALRRRVVPQLTEARARAREARARKIASSRVEFFTMVRGEG
jgi:alpha-D-ribose 1-methylphosphonate 5-triphosphate synthase subunit PhnG